MLEKKPSRRAAILLNDRTPSPRVLLRLTILQ